MVIGEPSVVTEKLRRCRVRPVIISRKMFCNMIGRFFLLPFYNTNGGMYDTANS